MFRYANTCWVQIQRSCFPLPHFCIEEGAYRWDYCRGKMKQKEIFSELPTSYFLSVESFNWIKMENVL